MDKRVMTEEKILMPCIKHKHCREDLHVLIFEKHPHYKKGIGMIGHLGLNTALRIHKNVRWATNEERALIEREKI